jgi:hypothetical protein
MAEKTTKSRCLIHFDGQRGPLTAFTEVSFQEFLLFREQWAALDGEQRQVAEKSFGVVTGTEKPRSRKLLLPQRMLF